MNAKLRVGLVGAGWVSAYHLAAWRAVADAEVVAIADRDRGRAQQRASTFGIPRVRDDVVQMLDGDHLDALDVATPMQTHAACCRLAAARGVAVLCQKPLAPSFAEARELVNDVAGRTRLMVNENWRFRPHYRQVRRWIDEATGAVQQLRLAVRSSGLMADAAGSVPALTRQPFLATLERFVIAELLIHHLDVVRWLVGPLEVRAAVAMYGAFAGEHAATILLESAKGCAVTVEGNLAAPGFTSEPVDALEIVGAQASVRLDGDVLSLIGTQGEADTRRIDLAANYQQGFTAAAAHFAACLRADEPFESDAVDNLATLALVDDAYRHLGACR